MECWRHVGPRKMIKDNSVCVLANVFKGFLIYQLLTVGYSENDNKISVRVNDCERITAITWRQGQYPSEIAVCSSHFWEKHCLVTFPVIDVPP